MHELWQGVADKIVVERTGVDEPAPASVHHLPPLVTARPEVPVEVWEAKDKAWYPGMATHWRGERVMVRYSKGVGMQCLGWVQADEVRRVEAPD